MAGSSQLQGHRSKVKREVEIGRSNRSKSRNEIQNVQSNDSESDTSGSQIIEFSNMSTYRVPAKSRGGIFNLRGVCVCVCVRHTVRASFF